MTKERIIEILEGAKDRNGDVPFEIAVKAINKMAENIEKSHIKALPSPQTEPELTELLVFCPKCGHTMSVIDKDTLVRCRDCTYWMPHTQLGYDEDNETYHDYCAKLIPEDEYYAFPRDADDFCSRGVRRSTDERKTE